MKISYNKTADALYFRMRKGIVAKTVPMNENVIIDVNKDGKTLGVELLGISSKLGLDSSILNITSDAGRKNASSDR